MEAKLEQQLAGIIHEPFFKSSSTLGRPTINWTEGDEWKYYAGIAWDLEYSDYYSGIGMDRGWFQSQGSTMGAPSARVEG